MKGLLILASLAVAVTAAPQSGNSNSDCAQWCAANFPQPGSCTSQATQNKGPCYDCGPGKSPPGANLMTDPKNCGACGNPCTGGGSCVAGKCQTQNQCSDGQNNCAGQCVNTMTDVNNCGTCGTKCSNGQTCSNGKCQTQNQCSGGQNNCAGQCVNTMTDVNNCGTCGTKCDTGATCSNGWCQTPTCTDGKTKCPTGHPGPLSLINVFDLCVRDLVAMLLNLAFETTCW
ncbi:putative extracellular cysteine-rich protein [Aspergillus saccharolyticus JOP 1030-1]|uniref:TNFR-Cys domain-containing protein n=1 Tax=Aspergillus saccharolyticus JOP 1030-1 TaxID=1450539 RepID=A0A318ZX86_9EURO|nr:hypothetical protein BP01DRAFT_423952 [Aspergillus saccharolyticus JOP 1030-1]PYH44748.1 hypothetical protein BP01DRAFT_423952 [Aspergillus saccharolyticus JOP 1030-1]